MPARRERSQAIPTGRIAGRSILEIAAGRESSQTRRRANGDKKFPPAATLFSPKHELQ
jgi:hypothetical protein